MSSRIVFACLSMLALAQRGAEAQSLIGAPLWKADGNQASAGFGSAVAAAGDVNGDGYGDILVGAYLYDGNLNNAGSAALFLGSPAGPSKTPDWFAEGNQASANFGGTVAGAGDVNGDGYDDVIVGAHQARRVRVYHGSAAGLATSADWTASSADYDFGWSVSSAGDVNGDGYDDVIVGAPRWNNGQNDEGRVFAYFGSAGGLVTTPAWNAEPDQAGALLGYWVSSAGDVNGDGYDEVIASANIYSHGEEDEGAAFVYQGSPAGPSLVPTWTLESNQFAAIAGGVSSGDLDGDGYGDVLVGYYAYDRGQVNEGAVFAYFGSPSGLAAAPGWLAESNQRNSMFGFALAGAGDVNGDGFDDVLVGAYEFDAGERNEGRAFTYLGSSRRRQQ